MLPARYDDDDDDDVNQIIDSLSFLLLLLG